MKTLKKELKKIGFSDGLIDVIASTSEMKCYNIDIDMAEYQTYEDIVISTDDICVTECNTKTDVLIEKKNNQIS